MSGRVYLSIGEVLSLLQDEFPDVTISKIRFLESQGLIDPERTPSGYRKFFPGDIERLRFILREQREHFLPLKVIKDRLEETLGEGPPEPDLAGTGEADSSPGWVQGHLGTTTEDAGTGDTNPEDTGTDDTGSGKAGSDVPALTPTGVSLTVDELATASGLAVTVIGDLEQYGLLAGRKIGPVAYYDEEALVVAKLAAGFLRHGIEPRHLRMYRTTADREASLFEQVVLPLVKQRNPRSRAAAATALADLTRLGEDLRAASLRHALRTYTEGL